MLARVSHPTVAYLDAGSASMVLQLIGGAVAAAAVMVKLFWRRILRALHLAADNSPEATGAQPEQRPADRRTGR